MKKTTFAATLLVAVALTAQMADAQSTSKSRSVDSNARSLTYTQTTSAMDADLAERVRRSVVADRNLSSYAAKINIVSNDGTVLLSGLVQNDGEKAQIASKAAIVAGQRHIVNDLRVMANVPDGTALRELLRRASAPRAAVVAAN